MDMSKAISSLRLKTALSWWSARI